MVPNALNQTGQPRQALLAGLAAALASTAWLASPAGAQEYMTLRDPYIPGAIVTPPMMEAPAGNPPPPGDGMTPLPVTPGMLGGPLPPPSQVPMPPVGPCDQSLVNSYAQPYLTPPPSTPGSDPGILPGTTSGYKPPAIVTTVSGAGGLQGNAPIQKWQGQTSRDFGNYRTFGSQTTDFGQNVVQISPVQLSQSEDGPRGLAANGAPAQPNLSGAQQTTDLYGNRTLFRGPNLRAVMTIAPY